MVYIIQYGYMVWKWHSQCIHICFACVALGLPTTQCIYSLCYFITIVVTSSCYRHQPTIFLNSQQKHNPPAPPPGLLHNSAAFQKNFYCSLISNLNTICYQPFLSENILRQCQLFNHLALFYLEILQFIYNKQQPTLTSDFVLRSDSSSRNKQNQPSSPDFHFFHFGLIHHRILIQELIGLGLPSHHQQINKPGLNEQCRGSSAFSKLSFTRIVTTYSY